MISDDVLAQKLKDLSPRPSHSHVAYQSVMTRVARRTTRRRAVAGGGALAALAAIVAAAGLFGGGGIGSTELARPGDGQLSSSPGPQDGVAAPLDLNTFTVASGTIGSLRWSVAAGNFDDYDDRTCLLAQDDVFERSAICFAVPGADGSATWIEVDATKRGVAATGVFGVATQRVGRTPVTSALITMSDGRSFNVPVVTTPASDQWAYFATAVEGRALDVDSVQLFSDSQTLGPPQTAPAANALPCRDSAGNDMPCPVSEPQDDATNRQ